MADQQVPLGDWRPVRSPDGRVFYFNSRRDGTSWVVPKSPPASETNATTPASPPQRKPLQNSGSPLSHQSTNGQGPSPTLPNYSFSPRHPDSSNAYSHPHNPCTTTATPPSLDYGPPPRPPVSSPYSQHQPPRPETSRPSTSFRSLLDSAGKAVLFPGQFDASPYGNGIQLPSMSCSKCGWPCSSNGASTRC